MKARLLYADRDVDPDWAEPPLSDDLVNDLDLATLWSAMARGDRELFDVARIVMLHPLVEPDQVRYRQAVLDDCRQNVAVVGEIFRIVGEAFVREKGVYHIFYRDRPEQKLSNALRVLDLWVDVLRQLRTIADEHLPTFRSDGFRRHFSQCQEQLSDDYLDTVRSHLAQLRFPQGMLFSARLGRHSQGVGYTLRRPHLERRSLFNRTGLAKPTFTYTIPARDIAGFNALADIRDRGLTDVAETVARSMTHVRGFLQSLRFELAFYLGGVNLADMLAAIGVTTCTPEPMPAPDNVLTARGLSEPCLALRSGQRLVENDLDASAHPLLLVTGPNQGGKSTFLRGLGVAQMMMQAGLFVAAAAYSASTHPQVLTHFKREEDAELVHGKFDEELDRMSRVIDVIEPHALLLSNESFAATNGREGSEIGLDVINALLAHAVTVGFVTHLYDLAHRLWSDRPETALFLRAEREESGDRTFRITAGEPLSTSYGEDVFTRVFGHPPRPLTEPARGSARPDRAAGLARRRSC